MSKVITVTGYFRSGTSALAGALNQIGVTFVDTAKTDSFNPKGFYEISDLILYDEYMFSCFGMKWSDIRPLPNFWWLRPEIQEKISILHNVINDFFKESNVWGIKHPDHCRLLPFYNNELSKLGHQIFNVNITRSPWISAASQIEKNGLSKTHSLLLWAIYVIEAQKNSNKLQRSWITYEDMLDNPIKTFKKIEYDLDMKFNGFENAEAFIIKELNHNNLLPRAGIYTPLVSLVDSVWEAVKTRNFDQWLWFDFEDTLNDIVRFVVDMGISQKVVAPGISEKK